MRLHPTGVRSALSWRVACVLLILCYAFIWSLHQGKYQESSDGHKYDIAAEVFHRLLFTGQLGDMTAYARDWFGLPADQQVTSTTAISDERPVFFFYLALVKLAGPAPVGLHFAIGLALLLWSVLLLAQALNPPDKPLFLLVCGLLLSPYFVFQAFAYQPHVLQIFFTCWAFSLYVRGKIGRAFCCMTLSFFAHGLNLILLGCLGLYLLQDRPFRWRSYARAFLGVLAAWLAVELVLAFIFWRDATGMLPHVSFFEQFFLKSDRVRGGFARGDGLAHGLKSIAILMPLGLAGLLLVRRRIEFALTLLPLGLFILATKGQLSGDVRVLAPIFFIGHALFIARAIESRGFVQKSAIAGLVLVGATLGTAYYWEVARCMDISRDAHAPVSVCGEGTTDSALPAAWLHWNLRRYHPVQREAAVEYCLRPISRLELPKVPDANSIQANQVFIALSWLLPLEKLKALGSLTPTPPVYGLMRETVPDGR